MKDYIKNNDELRILCALDKVFLNVPSTLTNLNIQVLLNSSFKKLTNYVKQPKSLDEVHRFLAQELLLSNSKINLVLDYLIEKGLLKKNNTKCYDDLLKWSQNNWSEAFNFHNYTNNLPKMMYNTNKGDIEDREMMEEYVKEEKIPSNYKIVNSKTITLDKPKVDENYKMSLIFSSTNKVKKLTIPLLSRILYYGFGQTGKRYMKVTGEHIRKTVPSGGARHPIEIYLFIKDIEDILSGIYHYNVKEHGLTLIKHLPPIEIDKLIREKLLMDDNRCKFEFHMGIIYSCIFERSMFRYRESRSYRVMHFDLGHLLQNLSFIIKCYGLNMYAGYSLSEKNIEDEIGLDSILESSLAYTVI